MKTIYLISCCKEKLPAAAKAKDLYQSEGFKHRLSYARFQKADEILVLSAKHHVVELDQVLEPYDVCLSNETVGEQKKWAEICIATLKSKYDLTKDKFVILASEDYYKNLISSEVTLHNTLDKQLAYDVHYSIESCINGEYIFHII